MNAVKHFQYEASNANGKLTVKASGVIPTPAATVFKAHSQPEYASAFRDIGKYVLFVREGHVISTAYPAKAGPITVPLAVKKCVSPGEGTIDFWTADASMVSFRGRWSVAPRADGTGTTVHLNQTMDIPRWIRWLPLSIDSSVKGRVVRAFEDMAAL